MVTKRKVSSMMDPKERTSAPKYDSMARRETSQGDLEVVRLNLPKFVEIAWPTLEEMRRDLAK